MTSPPPTPRESFRAGLRAGLPFAIAGCLVSLTFGVLAREVGFSALGAIVMSAIVFAGSAQFAVVSILAGGGADELALSADGRRACALAAGRLAQARGAGPDGRRCLVGDGQPRRGTIRSSHWEAR